MHRTHYGTLTSDPDAFGFATVVIGDATRLVWFNPLRFVAPWPVPTSGDSCAIVAATATLWHALWVVKQGTPTYTWTG